jgi:signal transduction histidine kinase
LGVQAGLLVVGCLVVVGTILFLVYERAADEAANRLLHDATTRIDAAREAPPGVEVVVVTPGRRSMSSAMPDGFPDEQQIAATERDGRTRQTDVERAGVDYTIRTAAVRGRVTQAVLDRRETDEERERILLALLEAGVVGVLLAALVAAWLARRTVRPMADTIAMQRRFVADASHELRTPLTLLSTRAQLLARRLHRDPEDTSRLLADVDGVVADTQVLTDILEDLLAASDTRGSAKEVLDVVGLTREAAAAAAAAADASNATLTVSSASEEVLVDGSSAALRRAVIALVDNAVDHATTAVEVAVRRRARHVAIEVCDDGPGISTEAVPRLFDRFSTSRAPGSSAGGRRHYGLGLALVADVAADHDGEVTVAPRQDGRHGAVFTLTLPVHRGA